MQSLLTPDNIKALLAILATVVGFFVSRRNAAASVLAKAEAVEKALAGLRDAARISVKSLQQQVVRGLKDTSAPGVWDVASKRAVREQAMQAVSDSGALWVALLRSAGLQEPVIRGYIAEVVEAAVLELSQSVPQVSAVSVSSPIAVHTSTDDVVGAFDEDARETQVPDALGGRQ